MKGTHEPNNLINASSPYLLQHAYNPVRWFEWGDAALDKARSEDKPIILSIGYSSCHWCHVMEEQDFENEEIAEVMNRHFVPVKVDREERPDIDQLYMEAAQLMDLGGGWPLNVFLTPGKKPFYACTYLPPEPWLSLLQNVVQAWREQRSAIVNSAEQCAQTLNVSELKAFGVEAADREFTADDLDGIVRRLAESFDRDHGGALGAPKFPLPVIQSFLLRCHAASGNQEALDHAQLTLDKMALGGIYDQAGGGFARYSTDARWFAPHFEKMLYDNAQLLSLYADAFRITGKALYREVIEETMAFIQREMTSPEGGFYSALDADSEGVEGKYYVWEYDELEKLAGAEMPLLADYYGVTREGNWENGNILHRGESDEAFAARHGMAVEELKAKVQAWKKTLHDAREERIRPGLDDKILASWNGMMLKGCVDAYRALHHREFLDLAVANGEFIARNLLHDNGRLLHMYKDGKAGITGYLEDYAHVIQGLHSLYEITFEEKWIRHAQALTHYTLNNFFDRDEQLFFFTDAAGEQLIARKKQLTDNVIPASNSVMAHNLLFMGVCLENDEWVQKARDMLGRVSGLLLREPRALANWCSLLAALATPGIQVAIVGERCRDYRERLESEFHPNIVFLGTESASELPLLRDHGPKDGQTTVFVCRDHACLLPVHTAEEALQQIRSIREE